MKNNKDGNKENTDLIEENISEEETEILDENQDGVSEAKDREIEELSNKMLRLQADFMNFKKRAEKEKESTIAYAVESFACGLLPIVDNFQRAMESEEKKEDNFYKGIEMIYQQFIKVLNENDIEELNCLGEEFDPNYHHAVFMEDSDVYESGKITEILQRGYKLKDRVIRPAMVKVAK